jgi:Domain of unknown function (DUF4386)
MSMTIAEPVTRTEVNPLELRRTARITGLLYLGLGVTGMLGFLVIRNQIFVSDDPGATLANLTEHAWLSRAGVALELGIVLTQALAAVWFYRLFRSVDSFAAGSLAAFGLVNAAMISSSAAMLAAAIDVSRDSSLAAGGDNAATAQLLYVLSGHFWGVGAIFFGLWLIPMGRLVLRSGWLPPLMGRILIGGGALYVLSAFVTYLFTDTETVVGLMALPATIGEFWILGYLITRGVRNHS